MIIVTGGAGFIGSNLIAALNQRGEREVLLVDNLRRPEKLPNLLDVEICDYLPKGEFRNRLKAGGINPAQVRAVFHLGACSDTMEQDGAYMMDNNYAYARDLLAWCLNHRIACIYASSAAVYGASQTFVEEREYERPLNIYGYSKFLFDQCVRQLKAPESQIVGLRYFNVYGPGESHKGRMASVAWHHYHQLAQHGHVELFTGSHGYGEGEQQRDFIYVADAVAAKLYFLDNPNISGIFNLGTGRAQSFNQLALAGVNAWRKVQDQPELDLAAAVAAGYVRYKDFPPGLEARYQAFTQADITRLRASGFDQPMRDVQAGVGAYFARLDAVG